MLEIELKKKFTKDLKKHILNQKIELEVFDLVVENLRNQIPLGERFKPPKQKSQISLVFGMNATNL